MGFAGSGEAPLSQAPFIPPDGVTGPAQVQALTNDDLKQLDGLNIQGVKFAIYLRGVLAGVVRPDGSGGDLVIISAPAPTQYIGTWLIVQVLEQWPNWVKAVMVKQGGA